MRLLPHLGLFFVASFVSFWHLADKRSIVATLLVIGLPTAGVYWLDWLGLLTYIAGYLLGIYLFLAGTIRDKDNQQK
jgi:hypothetical protein